MSLPAQTREISLSTTAGAGHIEVNFVSGQSTVTSAYARSPLKFLIPRPRGPSAWIYLSSFGGGLVAGDELRLAINLGAQSRCFFTTQASTKVYRNPAGLPCGHTLQASLGAGSQLALLPEPVQAFAGSHYKQSQEFHLAHGSSLVLVDWLCCGRLARGERWAFTRFESRNEVFLDSERLLFDSLLLEPADGALDSPHRLGRFNCLALMLVLGEPLREAAARVLEDGKDQPITPRASLVCSLSPVRGGALLRAAGERLEDVARELRRRLAFLTNLIGDDPWARKW
jgi:urease accessory protein